MKLAVNSIEVEGCWDGANSFGLDEYGTGWLNLRNRLFGFESAKEIGNLR